MMALYIAKLRGASKIIMLGTNRDIKRMKVARQIGATHTLNIDVDNPIEFVRDMGDGYGADLIVDCTGVSIALKSAMEMVRPNGIITKIGWGPQPLHFSLDPLVQKAATLQASFSHLYSTWERVLGLLSSGQIDLTPVIGGVYPLGEWEEAFEEMEAGNNVKSVLLPA
jgi:alcohol dehydrogenase/L-iditol 2-dehydrogenase